MSAMTPKSLQQLLDAIPKRPIASAAPPPTAKRRKSHKKPSTRPPEPPPVLVKAATAPKQSKNAYLLYSVARRADLKISNPEIKVSCTFSIINRLGASTAPYCETTSFWAIQTSDTTAVLVRCAAVLSRDGQDSRRLERAEP
jgi:hypothetical protein